jgi:hypothetical protein
MSFSIASVEVRYDAVRSTEGTSTLNLMFFASTFSSASNSVVSPCAIVIVVLAGG